MANELSIPARPSVPDRHIVVVDRSFQLKYTFWLAFLGGFASVLCGGLMYMTYLRIRGEVGLSPDIVAALEAREGRMLLILSGIAVLMTAGLGLAAMVVTHRIAGPVYVMTRYLSVLAQGRYPPMRPLRKHDELKEVFSLFQKSVEYIRARDVEDAYRLGQAIERLAGLTSRPEVADSIEILRAMHLRKREAVERPAVASAVGVQTAPDALKRPDTRFN